MKKLKYFLDCYFHFNADFTELDELIEDFKKESSSSQLEFIYELREIIDTKNYAKAARIIKRYGERTFDLRVTKKFINYLYDKLLDKPTTVKATDLIEPYKIVFCPICTQDPKLEKLLTIIYKATIVGKDIEIYLCKTCETGWLDEDNIQSNNGHNYRELMKANGLRGWWKELKDVDFL